MKTCRSCGIDNPEDSKFCIVCGAGLAAPPPPADKETACANCGEANAADAKFCIKCGKPLAVAPPAAPAPAFCTSCGAKLDADSKFCMGCGAPLAGTAIPPAGVPAGAPGFIVPAPSFTGSPDAALAAYWTALDARLAQSGFEKFEKAAALAVDRVLRRKRFELTKAGSVTTFCAVKWVPELTDAFVKSYTEMIFDFANSNKGYFARNAFQPLVVYPVIITPACPPSVETFLNSHWPKHWMAYEFTVVAALASKALYYHRGTPVYGMAYHAGFKREADQLFQP